MQSFSELFCCECNSSFSSASSLLKHFAMHASHQLSESADDLGVFKRTPVPDLFPISSFSRDKPGPKDTKDVDDRVAEEVNPAKYCVVTLQAEESNETAKEVTSPRKYKCVFCSKTFGWSTDLKRHILVHTGERPFKCSFCSLSFTRKFLLQKHEMKQHPNAKSQDCKMPALKPLSALLRQKSRKQDKHKIIRKSKHLYPSINDGFEMKNNLVCFTN